MAESGKNFSWPWKGKKESTKTNRSPPGITISAPFLRQDITIPPPLGVKTQRISAPILRQDIPIPLPRKANPPPLMPPDVSDIPADENEDWEQTWGTEDDGDVPGLQELDPMSPSSPQSFYSNVFKSNKVVPLTPTDFQQFIKGMEKAMVMFYNPMQGESAAPGRELGIAADSCYHENHAFAAVDCSLYEELCCTEEAWTLPIFKLYSNGYELSTLRELKAIKAGQLKTLMTMTPVLTQPRQKCSTRK